MFENDDSTSSSDQKRDGEPDGFFGTITDMGEADGVGVGDGK